MDISFLHSSASVIFLLLISSITYIFSKKINFPYTILLVIIWLILVPLSEISYLSFIRDFSLNPDLLFFVFLPLLLFEAAYNINAKELWKNWKTISILAVFWVLVSSLIIWSTLYLAFQIIWLDINLLICFLFWSLISATDPVAVLVIFKWIWAPKRLTLLFEWESLFNDGTSVALFMITLGIIMSWWAINSDTILIWLTSFSTNIFWWIIIWWTWWYLFSKLLWRIQYNEEAEITIAIISSYTVFIISEFFTHQFILFPVSWIIATVVSSIIIWNYWKYKITPKSEAHMNKFLDFFTFIVNSLVFILMWLILSNVETNFIDLFFPILITVLVLLVARFISVYLSIWIINMFNIEEKIPKRWMSILSWGWLKWVLAIMLVMMIPSVWDPDYIKILEFEQNIWWVYSYHFKDFLIVLTLSSIMLSLFIKAPTIAFLMRRLGVWKIETFEQIEEEEWKIISNLQITEKINKFYKNDFLDKKEYLQLKDKYKKESKQSVKRVQEVLKWKNEDVGVFIKRIIYKYALWIERQYLKKLFFYKKIEEKNFLMMLNDIEYKIESINERLKNGKNADIKDRKKTFFNKLFRKEKNFNIFDIYIINRTKYTIWKKVIKDLKNIPNEKSLFDEQLLKYVIWIYEYSCDLANKKRIEIKEDNKLEIALLEQNILNKTFLKVEEKLLKDLYNKEIIPANFYNNLIDNLHNELYNDTKPTSLT